MYTVIMIITDFLKIILSILNFVFAQIYYHANMPANTFEQNSYSLNLSDFTVYKKKEILESFRFISFSV